MAEPTVYCEMEYLFDRTNDGTQLMHLNNGPVDDQVVDFVQRITGASGLVAPPAGMAPMWSSAHTNAGMAPNVWHTFKVFHTPVGSQWQIDGVALGAPDDVAAYQAFVADKPVTDVRFKADGGINDPPQPPFGGQAMELRIRHAKIGVTYGGAEWLDYDPAVDGFNPFSDFVGDISIDAGHLVLKQPPEDSYVVFELGDTNIAQIAFAAGLTRNSRLSVVTANPDDETLNQADLPELLLSEGYTVTCGTYDERGVPRMSDSVVSGSLRFRPLDTFQDEV